MKAVLLKPPTSREPGSRKTASLRLPYRPVTKRDDKAGRRRRALALLSLLLAPLLLLLMGRLLWPFPYQAEVVRWSQRHGVDPYLVASVALHESRFRPHIVSDAGAVGLMQLMPETAQWLVSRQNPQEQKAFDLHSVDDNLELGSLYLSELMQLYAQDEVTALAAYNAGPGVVARWSAGRKFLSLEDVGYPETRHYVRRVRAGRHWLKALYPALPQVD